MDGTSTTSTTRADATPAAFEDISPPERARSSASCATCHLAPECLPATVTLPEREQLRGIVRALPPFDRHDSLFEGGDPHGQLFIVRSGCFQTSVQEANGEEQVVGFHLPGDITGFGTGIETFRGGRAAALERSTVCAVNMRSLLGLAGRIDGLHEQIFALMEKAMTRTEQHVLMMGRRGAEARVALFLHDWSRRMQRAGFSPTDLHLPMRRGDIASYLALVTETTSRAISHLHELGILRVPSRNQVQVLEPEQLAAMAGMDSWGG